MNNKQQSEVTFWRSLFNELGETGFDKLRLEDYKEKTKYFAGLGEEEGIGIDLGCGLKSIFEHSNLKMVAVDPLMDEYRQITTINDDKVKHILADAEDLPFDKDYFDFAVCINVLDHTPNPEKLLAEVKRTVKKGGKFYFQVNFDDYLATPHYFLMTEQSLKELMKDFREIKSVVERNEKDRQTIFNAIYEV